MNDTATNGQQSSELLAGGGEMGALIRSFDWSQTPLGAYETWSQSLRTVVRLMLNSRFSMFIWWGEHLINLYNDAYAPTLGIRHPHALGQPASEIWAEIWHDLKPQVSAVLERGEATWDEELLLLPERSGFKEETYHTFSYSPAFDDTGKVGGLYCAVMEVTAQVLSRRRLTTLHDLSEQTAQATTVEAVCGAACQVLTQNPRDIPFALLYLLDTNDATAVRAETIGVDHGDLMTPERVALGSAADVWRFSHVLHTGRAEMHPDTAATFGRLPAGEWTDDWTRQAFVIPLTNTGRQERPAGFLVAGISPRLPFGDEYREFLELVAGQITTAITNARALEQERKRAEALAALDRAKTEFFSNVSHEFRTPLTLMLAPLEDVLNLDETLPPVARTQLETVNRNALRLLKLVNNLLDFSRIEAGRTQARYEATDIAAWTAELASTFRSAIEKAGISFTVDCPPLVHDVFVDREMWEKIVLNLLSNAFKFTFAGEIAISLHEHGGMVALQVRDTGVGIPADQTQEIFKRFHRVRSTQGRTHEGSGIGLSLVDELVKLHGGEISVASELGTGTIFTVTIPIGSAHLPAEHITSERRLWSGASRADVFLNEISGGALAAEALIPPTNGEQPSNTAHAATVLLADDNADMREYVRRLLSERYNVQAVADGRAALAAIRQRTPDLVLTDVMMPQLDGFGLLQALRADEHTRDVPVILLSARAGEEARVEGVEAGADDYLIKPFSARELLARVEGQLKMQRMRRESQAALRASEAKFSISFQQSPLALMISAVEHGQIIDVNDAFARLSGYTRDEVLGHTPEALHLWVDPQQRVEGLGTLRAGGQIADVEARFRIKSGEVRSGMISATLIDIDNRWHILSSVADVTERKLAEQRLESLQEVTARFAEAQTLAEVHQIMLANVAQALGADSGGLRLVLGQQLVINEHILDPRIDEGALRHYRSLSITAHHPAADAVRTGDAVLIGTAEEFIQQYPDLATMVIHQQTQATAHLPLKRGDEVFGVLSMSFFKPHRWNDAERHFALTLANRAAVAHERARLFEAERDVRRRLEETSAVLGQAVEAARMIAWEWDTKRNQITTSDTFEHIYGLPAIRMVEEGFQLVHPDDLASHQAASQNAAATGGTYHSEFRITRPDNGQTVWLEEWGFAVAGDDGEIQKLVGITMDITGRKQTEVALRASAARATFRAKLAETLRPLAGPLEIQAAVARVLGQHLGVNRAFYGEGEPDGTHVVVHRDYHNGVASAAGRYHFNDFGRNVGEALQAGRTLAVNDVATDATLTASEQAAFAAIDVQAHATVSLIKGGRLVAVLGAHASSPRVWTPDEIALLDETAERTWATIEREQALAALREREIAFRTLAESVPQIVWVSSADGAIEYINEQWLAYTGLTYEASLRDTNQAVHPDDIAAALATWQESQRTETVYEVRLRLRRFDGEYRWFLSRAIPVRDTSGSIARWFGTSTDIHESEVREQDTQFLSNLGELIRISENADTLMAMAAEMIGQYVQATRCCFAETDEPRNHWSVASDYHAAWLPSMVGEYHMSDFPPAILADLRSGRMYISDDNTIDPRSAEYYATYEPLGLRAHVVVPFHINGRWVMNLLAANDEPRQWQAREISLLETAAERVWHGFEKLRADAAVRASEERLQTLYAREQAARAQAEEASRLKDEFLATVSHELRTPLTSILGYGQLLQSRQRDPAYTVRTIDKIVRSAKVQAQLIEDLLDVSRIVSGKLRLEPQAVDLVPVIHAAIDAVRPAIDAKALQLHMALSENESIVVGDPNRLQQVVWNLLSNAAKFTPHHGTIELQLQPQDRYIQLIVRDTGQGISADFLPHVFERFRQAEGTSTRTNGGLGLGLSIVRHLVEMHGGAVEVHSDGEGLGASFTVLLPRVAPTGEYKNGEQTPDQQPAPTECPPELRKLRILVIDDQQDILELLEEILSQCSAIVRTCTNAADGLAELRAWQPDVLLSDIAMSGQDGYWLIEQVRALAPDNGGLTPAIALTAYVRMEERLRVLSAGFHHYVPKPIEPAELLAIIANLVRSYVPDERM